MSCTGDYASYVGDGMCDSFINTEDCDWDGGDCCLEENCSECIDPAALATLPCSEEGRGGGGAVSASPAGAASSGGGKDAAAKVAVGLGVACVVVSGVAFLGVSYSRLAKKEKEALAEEAAERPTNGGGGGGGGARTAQSTPAAGGLRAPEV